MQTSKSKTSLAYAKCCRENSQPHNKNSQPLGQHNAFRDHKQNICDEVFSELPDDQSNYINNLLHKKLAKPIHNPKPPAYHSPTAFHDSSNTQDSSKQAHNLHVYSIEVNTTSSRPASRNQQKKQKKVQELGIAQAKNQDLGKSHHKNSQIHRRSEFIDNINEYLTELTTQQHRSIYDQRKTHLKSRQSHFRSGEIQEQSHRSDTSTVELAKYNIILCQFQKLLRKNDILEEKLEQKDVKLKEMTNVVANMCCEIEKLKRLLKIKAQERNDFYQGIQEDFRSKILKKQSTSKPKQSHVKRYSHIPLGTEYMQEAMPSKRQVKPFWGLREISYLNKFKEENYSLKKRRNPQAKKRKNRETDDSDQPRGIYLSQVRFE